jgi:archaemetzincin
MSTRPYLGLVPLAHVDPDILRHLGKAIADFLLLPVSILPPQPLPLHTYHPERNQYHATQLLESLINEEHEEKPFRILGITAVDLYIPIFTFVFGEAQLDGQAAIISLFRLGGGASGGEPSTALFLSRLIKLSLHELGHTFGLPHCRQDCCLMGFAANLEKLDQKKIGLCKYCLILLDDYLNEITDF